MNFLNNSNFIQKIFLFILIGNFLLGISIYNRLGLTFVYSTRDLDKYFLDDIFVWDNSGFWWSVNIVLLIGFYLFKNIEK
tara:strand:- start:75 stop:314 length:240 start_codon:yes stop_codon:yes gene_type:complete